jgi:hypothetical protein
VILEEELKKKNLFYHRILFYSTCNIGTILIDYFISERKGHCGR